MSDKTKKNKKPKKEKKMIIVDGSGNELNQKSPHVNSTAHLNERVLEQEVDDEVFVIETRTIHKWNGAAWEDTLECNPGSYIPEE